MNHRSTVATDDRALSAHRYRLDSESFGVTGGPATPSMDQHRYSQYSAIPAAVPQAEYGYDAAGDSDTPVDNSHYHSAAYQNAGYDNAWAADNESAQQEWQENSWSDGGAWDSGNAWAEESSWAPEENSWVSEDGGWASEESWAPEVTEPESDTPAGPTVIPARRGANKRGGAHRLPAPPAALKGRAAVAAVAAGAVVAAGQAAFAAPEQPSQTVDYEAAGQVHEIAAQSMSVADPSASPESPQVLNVSAPADLGQFNDILHKGQKYAEDLAAQEAAKLRPLFTKFAAGTFTSGFGARWGVQHLGIDIAGPIGTPIYAVADATVVEAGPAAGFGMWVRLLHDDGTITIYGHIDTATVSQGQRVMAGDQIATIGNRGFSTGPHCHFEVWLHGVDKVDPLPWLASRGISLGPQRD
ncbi:M23 family metallopeptidase [Nocardia sp. NBC_00881]|uniref:M23 family metallopeptidase n=1 Tax=Nocardia sp. NBC_00881 TaxID=2975995 RepID=UPI00386B69AD|nr:M23 family metallopeptidase [Nocardia sp. NBC_00881]